MNAVILYVFLQSNGVAARKKTHETKAKLSLPYQGEVECIFFPVAFFQKTDIIIYGE